ncbi:MAG: sulfotransferase [Acidobacteria bacterium]|nr:sulfotransferase [Acidobacteriota bacterium]
MSDRSPDYGPAARVLHRLALARPFVAETFRDREEALHGRHLPAARDGAHVFVAGLARAGTTMLMRLLHGSGAFCSLTYRDMPFVLAPNAWAGLANLSRRDLALRERAHGDGIAVDADSPEALDEVFWRVLCGPSYIGPRTLRPMRADDDVLDRLRVYVALILKRYGAERYLSKNNNNVLRLPSIRRAFPRAVLLIPFRDPVQQARSLLAQHRRFGARQRESAFTLAYMQWLAHHEFGLDHRPFALPGGTDPGGGGGGDSGGGGAAGHTSGSSEAGGGGDPAGLAYWLHQWTATYGYLWRQAQDGGIDPIFVGYELLCREPVQVCDRLAVLLNVPRESIRFEARESRTGEPPVEDRALLTRALDLYSTLRQASRGALLT